MGDERNAMLRTLAKAANFSHRWATASAGAAVAHVLAAGNALAQAHDLCDDGEWMRWVRRNFHGSLRTAQRYIRLAKHWPRASLDATNVSPAAQAEAMRTLRRTLFGPCRRAALNETAGPVQPVGPAQPVERPPALAHAEREAARASLPLAAALDEAVRGLRLLADGLVSRCAPASAEAAAVAARIRELADELAFREAPNDRPGELFVYFIEAREALRVKIGVARDPQARLAQLQTASGARLSLLGRVRGGRAFEAALHQRFAELRIHGEWFHLTDGLRRAIARILADSYVEPPGTGRFA
ncbi:MAG: hypothetical protein B7Z73_00330 [Planctomycetia bacterium 21-64-5]|nr:MAG: hypothetical protein B7Z73_00330 [Planctomycetia bacterium 21-64-5]